MNFKTGLYLFCFLALMNVALASKPYFSNITQTNFEMDEYASFNYQLTAIDPRSDILNYNYITNWINFNINSNGLINFKLTGGNEGFYDVLVIVYDPFMNADVLTLTFNITNVNEKPIINYFSPDTNTNADEGSTIIFKINLTDPESDVLIYKWYLNNQLKTGTEIFEYNFDYNSAGTNNVTVLVTDSKETISKSWTININNVDRKPYLKENIPDLKLEENKEYTIDLSSYFKDDDNDILIFSIGIASNIESSVTNSIVKLKPQQDWYGASEIIFYAEDNKGNKIESNKINLIVEQGPECGNNKCEDTENCGNCEQDCKCGYGYICENSQCVEKELIQEEPEQIKEEEPEKENSNKITGLAIANISKPRLITAIIVIIVTLLFFFGMYWFVFRKKKEDYGF